MQLKYVSTLCFILGFAYANEPAKVYEEDSPDQSSEIVRKSRKLPDINLGAFSPSEFIYLKAAQQDPRSRRYSQQQQVDSENLSRIQGQLRKRNAVQTASEEDQKYAESRPAASKTWKVVHPKFVTEKAVVDKSDSGLVTEEKHKSKRENGEKQGDVPQNRTLQRRELIDFGGNFLTNSPAFYFEPLKNNPAASIITTKGGYYGVQNNPDKDINALNSLLGQTPMAQLRGLQQLLHSHAVKVAPLRQQDHIPINEHVDDIENPQTKPNVQVEPQPVAPINIIHQHEFRNGQAQVQAQVILRQQPNLNDLQAHLNAVSQMQANEAIAQAQQKALENVKLQHEALALAKIQAEKIALAQVESQNLALAHAQAEAQALAQTEAALLHQNALNNVKEEEHVQKLKANDEQVNENEAKEALLDQKPDQQNLALKILHQAAEEIKTKNAAIHARRQAQAYKELSAQQYASQNGLVSLDNLPYVHVPEHTFSYPNQDVYVQEVPQVLALTQQENGIHERPSGHDEHVEVQTYVQPDLEELREPEVKTEQDDAEYNEYASKYSFGYRVRDYHSGTNFGHEEAKEGKVIKGRYDVLLPDGRIQVVEYWADPSGYHAKVTYTNVAQH